MQIPRQLIEGEHAVIGDVIADSFAGDPVNRWIFGRQSAMLSHYTQVAKKLYLRHGYGHMMSDASGGTLWLPPSTQKNIPLFQSIDIAFSMISKSGFKSIGRGMAVDRALADKKPTQPHHYLFAIATRPSQQSKGIGGALMRAGLAQADLERMPAYLESSKEVNSAFYQKFGFEVIEKVTPAEGCPPLWLMWREAATKYK